MALAATFVWSALVSVLVTWWSGTPNALYGNRFEGAQFDTQNIAPIAFALFAVALGIAVGALLRRTLPAVVTTIVAYAAVRIVVAVYVRPHYAAAVTKIGAAGFGSIIPSGSWTLTSDLVGPTGEVVNGPLNLPLSCRDTATRDGLTKCLNQTGFHTAVHYHPAAQYWRFQWTESGLFLALAVALVALGVVWTLRHDA
jgi:hypothetical protein